MKFPRLRHALLAALLLATCFPLAASSQAEGQPLRVTKLIADEFPLVKVQIATWEASGALLVLIPDQNLRVSEDGVSYPVLSIEPVNVGVRLAFIIDAGDGARNTGVGLRRVVEIANEYLQTFLIGRPWMVAGVDQITVLVQEGDSTELVSPMSSDPGLIAQQLTAYTPPSDGAIGNPAQPGDFTRTGLRRALDELQFAPGGEDKPSAVVLFTPGMAADTSDLAQRAIDAGIPIHVVMTRDTPTTRWETALRPLAQVTGGLFETHYGTGDLEPMFEDLTLKRQQFHVAYRSTSPALGQRLVGVEIDGPSGPLVASGQYSVTLSPPAIEILSPAPGTLLNRQGQEGSDSPEDAEPTFLSVVAEVTWPDGLPRLLGPAQLLVDGRPDRNCLGLASLSGYGSDAGGTAGGAGRRTRAARRVQPPQ